MTTEEITIMIISSLLSGIVGVVISAFYYRRYENRKTKMDTFKKFFANRYDLKGDAFSQALNELFVVFKNSKQVMAALSHHHKAVINGKNSEDELVKLFKAMCRDLKLDATDFNDSFFLTPYNTRQNSAITNQSSEFRIY